MKRIGTVPTFSLREMKASDNDIYDIHKIYAVDAIFLKIDEQPNLRSETPVERMWRSSTAVNAKMSNIGYYYLRDARLHGSGFLFQGDALLDGPDVIPKYISDQIDNGTRWDFQYKTVGEQTIEELAILFVTDAHLVYGHWLFDMLPRLWFFASFFGPLFPGAKYLLPVDTPTFAKNIMRSHFGISDDRIIYYDFRLNDLLLKHVLVPSMLHVSHILHPIFNDFVAAMQLKSNEILENETNSSAFKSKHRRHLFISRANSRLTSTSYARCMSNEDAVISTAIKHGFEIIHPEEYGWSEQVQLFSNASVVAGESGSALHNTVFSPNHLVNVCMDPSNHLQGAIAAARQQRIIFHCSEDISTDPGRIVRHIDIDRFDETLTIACNTANEV